MNAVRSGLEIQKIKELTSGAHSVQAAVGIGSGMCAMATVSAAKLRFFVILGEEVSLATDLVMSKTGLGVSCPMLISYALYKEVCLFEIQRWGAFARSHPLLRFAIGSFLEGGPSQRRVEQHGPPLDFGLPNLHAALGCGLGQRV